MNTSGSKHDTRPLIRARNLGNGVIGSIAFWIDAIDYLELQFHFGVVGEDSRNAPVVLIAHHHSRHNLLHIESAIVEGADLTVLASCIINAHDRAIVF